MALASLPVSLAAMIAVRVFAPLAWTWYVLAGTAICFAAGWVASALFVSSESAQVARAAGGR